MLKDIFKDLKNNKTKYVEAKDGSEFELWFKLILKKFGLREIEIKARKKAFGFNEIKSNSNNKSVIEGISSIEKIQTSLIKTKFSWLKQKILLKNSIEIVNNPFININNAFIFQPFGSQQFPDFLIFVYGKVIPVEIKYTQNENKDKKIHSARPMWNSNLPKPNCLYIYGVAHQIITFFKGSSILDHNTREVLLNFFEDMDKEKSDLNISLKNLKNNFGLYPYIRKAYEHKKSKSTFFDANNRQVLESYFSENAQKRENQVINFLEILSQNNSK